jgi:hypothetical protein
VSGQPFPMPADAQGASGGGMARSGAAGKLSLYCVNGQTSELAAAPVPAARLLLALRRLSGSRHNRWRARGRPQRAGGHAGAECSDLDCLAPDCHRYGVRPDRVLFAV